MTWTCDGVDAVMCDGDDPDAQPYYPDVDGDCHAVSGRRSESKFGTVLGGLLVALILAVLGKHSKHSSQAPRANDPTWELMTTVGAGIFAPPSTNTSREPQIRIRCHLRAAPNSESADLREIPKGTVLESEDFVEKWHRGRPPLQGQEEAQDGVMNADPQCAWGPVGRAF